MGVLFCCEEFTGVALGPVERVLTDCVRTLSDGRLPCDDAPAAPAPADADADAVADADAWLAPGPEFGPMREGVIVRGTTSSTMFSAGLCRSAADLSRFGCSSSPAAARAPAWWWWCV